MFTKSSTMSLARKVAGATVICGALALGTGGVASAATTATTGHGKCVRADKALTKVDRAEAAIARRLPKLQGAQQKATTAGHTALATRIENRIHWLQKLDTKAGTLAHTIQTRCPSATPGTSGSTTGAASSS